MPPIIYLVRHGEAQNNIGVRTDANKIRDALLTDNGKLQCKKLQLEFPDHDKVSIVMGSPLRRAIQTAAIAFGPTIRRQGVRYLLVPMGQEISDLQCDIGHSRGELEEELGSLLEGQDIGFDVDKIDFELVEDGWNSKKGRYATDHESLVKRAADLRSWLYQRSEPRILFVTHGAFLHYLTEDWSGDDPEKGTAYLNCEVRIFDFTERSTKDDAHFTESEKSKSARVRPTENDTSVLSELDAVVDK